MATIDKIYKNIDDDETMINEMLRQLKAMEFYSDIINPIQTKYVQLYSDYYDKVAEARKNEFGLQTTDMLTTASRYADAIEAKVMEPLKKIYPLAKCRFFVDTLTKSKEVDINDTVEMLDLYIDSRPPENLIDDKVKLYDEIGILLYDLIKREAETKDSYELMGIVYDYREKGTDFVCSVNKHFQEDVYEKLREYKAEHNGIISDEYRQLVKHSMNSEFDENDIMNYLIATGKKKPLENGPIKDTIKFDNKTVYTTIPYTNRKRIGSRIMDVKTFKKAYRVNPLPKTPEENMKLREYDLTMLSYAMEDSIFGSHYYYPIFNGVDLSYTNAIIIPKYLGVDIAGANLEGVDLRGVDLDGVDITGANLKGTGANIDGATGNAIEVSPYIPRRTVVSRKKITPMEFEKLTKHSAFAAFGMRYDRDFNFSINYTPWDNRILRQYDLSSVEYCYEYFLNARKDLHCKRDGRYCFDGHGLDLSYTNISFDPQGFKSEIIMDLEGVDLRNCNFEGVEEYFAHCNLKGTGAHISPKINPTVSEYVVPTYQESMRRK